MWQPRHADQLRRNEMPEYLKAFVLLQIQLQFIQVLKITENIEIYATQLVGAETDEQHGVNIKMGTKVKLGRETNI